ncbi:hypothetical protein EDB83DRAFT_2406691 [Lactarius deliciosus]|nr:hypothetical protein EDB83DRAFT_2406691 [Lactarius deliciosus]
MIPQVFSFAKVIFGGTGVLLLVPVGTVLKPSRLASFQAVPSSPASATTAATPRRQAERPTQTSLTFCRPPATYRPEHPQRHPQRTWEDCLKQRHFLSALSLCFSAPCFSS